jgi:HSP20 family protein
MGSRLRLGPACTNFSRHNGAGATILTDWDGSPRDVFTQLVFEAPTQIALSLRVVIGPQVVRRMQEGSHQFNPPIKRRKIMRLVRYTYPSLRNPLQSVSGFARSPWSGLETTIDRFFSSALADLGGSASPTRFPVDLYEDKDNTYVRAELPGVKREDINVEMVDGYLTISAARKSGATDAEESFSLSRSVSIADEIQTDKVTAAHENGMLTVTLPKREEAKPKKITVAVK